MTLPQCLEPISQLAVNYGWRVDIVPVGSALDRDDQITRTVLAANMNQKASIVLRRIHTEAYDERASQLALGIRDALELEGREATRQRDLAMKRGERRSRRRKGA